ncbi:hypothetical protein FB382_004111 [Nocardioides ginsengisegetis]|uniref:Uncharacterized protein n=1 Tax=Nocardioides ginsengisegetis TaxID=661491 RepID=A0A7W3PBN8_9ACTN|nr:hypothetical protein [Nocardioides ginsengisegetis]MBA8805766.1 hypothetical protein [Nocardioides ginsengisegetis]
MSNESEDTGLTTSQLWRMAWVLGLVAVGSCFVLGQHAADHTRVQSGQLVWLAVGITSAIFSGCCAVLVGVKSAESRLTRWARESDRADR